MSRVIRITQSGLVKSGVGKIKGLVINSHTAGTLKLVDGLEGAAAIGVSTLTWANGGTSLVSAKHGASTLTSSGASVAATHAAGTLSVAGAVNFKDGVKATKALTNDASNITTNDTATFGTKVYTFKASPVAAYEVDIGANATESMFNLFNAAKYGTGPNGTTPAEISEGIDIVLTSALVITVTAKSTGTAGNAIAIAENSTHLSWASADVFLTGGLAAETVTIGTKVYTFKDELSTNPLVANEVHIGGTSALSLVNLLRAINAVSRYAGVSYSVGTVAHTQIVGYTSDATTVVIKARLPGASLNALATTETCASASFGDTTLVDGVASTGAIVTIGDKVYMQVDVLTETYGAVAIPYQFLRGASEATMLDALKASINGTSIGTLCSTGTIAHPYMIATTNADASQIIMTRTVGNAAYTAILNALPTTCGMANTAWTGTTVAGGTQAAVTTDNALLTIETRVYSIVKELSETSGATAVIDQILFGANDAAFLDNIKYVINGTGTAGTQYSTGTLMNEQVEAGTNAATTQEIHSKQSGVAMNAIATSTTAATYSWTSTVLGSGAGATGEVIFNTISFTAEAASGERFFDLGNVSFQRGLSAVVGGTADISLIID